MSRTISSTPFWKWNLGVWFSLGIVLFGFRLALHQDLFRATGLTLFQESLSIILCWGLHLIYQRITRGERFGMQTAAWLIGLSLVATCVQAAVAVSFIGVTGWRVPIWTPLEEWLLRLMFYWMTYMAFSFLYFWMEANRSARDEAERADAAESDAQRMELQLLRAQLDPHFLFNSLNGIATVVRDDPDSASAMVHQLADYLRYSLDNRNQSVVPLDSEIEAMTAYLLIEKTRFGDQVNVRIDATPEARKCKVPCFVLQPLIENAVKHSFQSSQPPWDIQISASRNDDRLAISVANTGQLNHRGDGVGLDVLKRRLELYYPGAHELDLAERDGSVVATLTLSTAPCFV